MPRNKIAKRTKKRQTINNVLANMQKIEMDLMRIPAKLAAQLNKEVNTHQRKERKLTKAVNKVNSLLIKAETRVQSAIESKTASSKKMLKKAKKAYNDMAKTHTELNNQLQYISNTLGLLLNKQDKLISLDKHLSQFEKEWAKASKKTKATAKSKKAKVKTKSVSPGLTVVEQSKVEPGQKSLDTIRIDEPAEIAS